MRRLLTLGLVIGIAAAAAGCGGSTLGEGHRAATAPPDDRQPAKAFSVPALLGSGTVSLAAERGRPVILNFWASWCEPCKRETPTLERFARSHPRWRVVGIAHNDDASAARAFARRYAVSYRLGLDRSGMVGEAYGITGLPYTFVIDRLGRVVSIWPGEIRSADLALLAGQVK
jgi:cytochrome c biogenesis protein CcmG/thiol:disulfide interchange protein DsbE